jgi:polyferredoxin
VLIYGAVLSAASVAFAASVALRSPFQFDVIKDRGTLARVVDEGTVENVYRIQIMNRTESAQTYRVGASGLAGLSTTSAEIQLPAAGIQSLVFSLRLGADAAQPVRGQSVPVLFEVRQLDPAAGAALAVQREKSTFFVPR